MSKKMNFIFFFPDEMRAESVSCYGHPLVKMPNYDRMAKEGVRFDKCFVQHPVCSPSRCCLMTGWYPHVNGHRTLWHLLRSHEPSMLKYLKEASYEIRWFGKNDVFATDFLDANADIYGNKNPGGGHKGDNIFGIEEEGYYTFLKDSYNKGIDNTNDMHNVKKAVEFLNSYDENQDKPFMLYLPLSMPHPPYSAPHDYHDMYDINDIEELRPYIKEGKPDFHRLIRKYRNIENIPKELLKKIQAVYLGMNSCMDNMLGMLLDVLDKTGLADNTTVIVSSDHGDFAGDYGLVEKWPSAMSDVITRVPLIIRMPENKAGHVVNEQVELFDIMPTVLELANVECKHTHFARSLVEQLNGASGDADRYVFTEGGYDGHELNCFEGYEGRYYDPNKMTEKHDYYPKRTQQQEHPESVCRTTMIRSLDYKLVRRTNGCNELYDLNKDPKELNNCYNVESYSHIRNQLEMKMLDWYMHTSDVVPMDDDNRGFKHEKWEMD
ncbi:sulfatase-like hydrolase/transferase [Vallitalea maricola]|uniref:Sulfatase-like hydrolase/transferase n=1 Tax=Vallitalea maricola TaxID=3074433 RepID=A0ACB5UGG5_9FIRM|nr:sulfatase-like hydrolase/transferase [Vallitalea sp. AN17-2]